MPLKSEDYKRLAADEVKLRVSIDKARSLVSSWVDSDSESDEDSSKPPAILNPQAGLGSKAAYIAVEPPSMALAKLKKQEDRIASKRSRAQSAQSVEDSGSDSEPLKGSARRKTKGSILDNYKSKKKSKCR